MSPKSFQKIKSRRIKVDCQKESLKKDILISMMSMIKTSRLTMMKLIKCMTGSRCKKGPIHLMSKGNHKGRNLDKESRQVYISQFRLLIFLINKSSLKPFMLKTKNYYKSLKMYKIWIKNFKKNCCWRINWSRNSNSCRIREIRILKYTLYKFRTRN